MDHHILARALLAVLCGCQAIATPAIDLNRTHATNPTWPGHARFHLVWQVAGVFLMSVFEVALIWWPGASEEPRFYLTAILTSLPLVAFLIAVITRKVYGGTTYDANGIPPARITVFSRAWNVELNLVVIVAALLTLSAILAIYTT